MPHKPKEWREEQIVKVKQKINKDKSLFFEKANKIDKCLTRNDQEKRNHKLPKSGEYLHDLGEAKQQPLKE